MSSHAARRRRPTAAVAVVVLALLLTGLVYAVFNAQTTAQAATTPSQTQVDEGRQLFAEGCSSCHGLGGQGTSDGPPLLGVGAAAVSFQVGTGRMPLADPTVQADRKPPVYNQEEIAKLAAFVATLGPGPAIPTEQEINDTDLTAAEGAELFRVNCAQCHSSAGQGGALSDGAFAPSLMIATGQEIYEAMLTGPQNMPKFGATLPQPEKAAIVAHVLSLQNADTPGGLGLGNVGPVSEGVFVWTAFILLLIAAAVWIGVKAR